MEELTEDSKRFLIPTDDDLQNGMVKQHRTKTSRELLQKHLKMQGNLPNRDSPIVVSVCPPIQNFLNIFFIAPLSLTFAFMLDIYDMHLNNPFACYWYINVDDDNEEDDTNSILEWYLF